jgi:hypothetical protein
MVDRARAAINTPQPEPATASPDAGKDRRDRDRDGENAEGGADNSATDPMTYGEACATDRAEADHHGVVEPDSKTTWRQCHATTKSTLHQNKSRRKWAGAQSTPQSTRRPGSRVRRVAFRTIRCCRRRSTAPGEPPSAQETDLMMMTDGLHDGDGTSA